MSSGGIERDEVGTGRRGFLAALVAIAWAGPASASDRRIVAYIDIDTPGARAAFQRFAQALQKANTRSGQEMEVRFLAVDQTDPGAVSALAAKVAELSPWLLVATSLPTSRAARELRRPTLFYAPADPVMLGLVASNSRPGGSMTGYAGHPPSIEKMLEVAAEALPRRRHVGVITDRLFAKYSSPVEELVAAGKQLGRRVSLTMVDTLEEFDAFAASGFGGAEALVIPYTAVPFRHSALVLQALARARLPAIHGSSRLVREGGLIGIEADISDVAEVFARQVASIAGGTSPGDIPVERPRRFAVSVNLARARALGLELPASFLKRADPIVPK